MDGASQTLAELDAAFARSRRDAAERRRARPGKKPPVGRVRFLGAVAVGAVGATLFVAAASDTQTASSAGKSVRVALGSSLAVVPAGCPVPKRFRPAFAGASLDTGLPLSLLVALAQVESSMDPNAVSPAGAVGLLQVMPATARELGLDPGRPTTNVLAGARYLDGLLVHFDGDLSLSLAAYNAGPAAVAEAGGAPSRSVHGYAVAVQSRAVRLAACDSI